MWIKRLAFEPPEIIEEIFDTIEANAAPKTTWLSAIRLINVTCPSICSIP
jgi:hypothetical protein